MAHQRSRISLRELFGVTADLSRAGDRTLSPAGSRMPVETPSQRGPIKSPIPPPVVAGPGQRSVGLVGGLVWPPERELLELPQWALLELPQCSVYIAYQGG